MVPRLPLEGDQADMLLIVSVVRKACNFVYSEKKDDACITLITRNAREDVCDNLIKSQIGRL